MDVTISWSDFLPSLLKRGRGLLARLDKRVNDERRSNRTPEQVESDKVKDRERHDNRTPEQIKIDTECCALWHTKNRKKLRYCIICGNEILDNKRLYCSDCNPPEYCEKYNEECREHNREKYNRECFFCGKSEEEIGRKHDTHHFDYNKNQGCDGTPLRKLVPLCKSCHMMTNGNIESRLIWESRILYLHKDYWRD